MRISYRNISTNIKILLILLNRLNMLHFIYLFVECFLSPPLRYELLLEIDEKNKPWQIAKNIYSAAALLYNYASVECKSGPTNSSWEFRRLRRLVSRKERTVFLALLLNKSTIRPGDARICWKFSSSCQEDWTDSIYMFCTRQFTFTFPL